MIKTYDHAGVQIYHGDCRELVLTEPADLIITDPPYSAQTHKGARTNKRRETDNAESLVLEHFETQIHGLRKGGSAQVTFEPLTFGQLSNHLTRLVEYVRTWAILTCDWKHATELEQSPPIGWEFVRAGVWVKPDGTPQMTGDRPGTGWESIAFLHRTKPDGSPMRKRWNGGGRNSVFAHGVCRDAMYPTQKPVALISEFVRLFSKPGDTILDPFCGSGTTLYAAKELHRKAIGCDVSAEACALAEKRLAQELLMIGEG